jgi:hypothetical protein
MNYMSTKSNRVLLCGLFIGTVQMAILKNLVRSLSNTCEGKNQLLSKPMADPPIVKRLCCRILFHENNFRF